MPQTGCQIVWALCLRRVIARQEIRATGLELWHQLLRQRDFDFRIAGFAERAEEAADGEGRTVFHHLRVPGIAQLLRFGEVSVYELSQCDYLEATYIEDDQRTQ